MGSSMESVRVVIFGNEYVIKSDTDVETTKQIAHLVNQKMDELQIRSSSRDATKLAVLTSMTIAGELYEIQTRYKESQDRIKELEEKIALLSKKIDEAL